MYKNKNDYSVTVFKDDQRILYVQYVHNIYFLVRWLQGSRKYSDYDYINVYNRRTQQFIIRYYKNDYVQPKPK